MKLMAVEEEYEKNADLKKDEVEALMNWAEKQPHLPNISELDTILFLHSCYYSQEAAKHTIDTYYTCRAHCDDIFSKWNPTDEYIKKSMDVMVFQPLPETTDDGSKIIFLRFQDSDASKFSVSDQIRVFCMSMKLWLLQEGTATGHVVAMDISGITTSHLMRLNILVIKKFFYFLQEAIPFRLKGFHFFDCVPFIDKVMAIIKPFIKDGIVGDTHYITLHTYTKEKREDLFKYIPQRCLPKDYGGQAPSVLELHETMKKRLVQDANFLQEVEKTQRVNEKMRPGRKNNIWSIEGSFKKLDID